MPKILICNETQSVKYVISDAGSIEQTTSTTTIEDDITYEVPGNDTAIKRDRIIISDYGSHNSTLINITNIPNDLIGDDYQYIDRRFQKRT